MTYQLDDPKYNWPYGRASHMQRIWGYDLEVTNYHGEVAENEKGIWEQYYLPADPKGKVVLSVGAGCGEDAAFYLSKGAAKVVCVESDPFSFKLLFSNVVRLGLPVEPIFGLFELKHMGIPHDILKMDGEECEKLLEGYGGELKPCFIEAHTPEIAAMLVKKFPLKRVLILGGSGPISFLVLRSSPLPEI